ncbi:DUF4833 domain-containing protein [Elusimicrobiota bacterium]
MKSKKLFSALFITMLVSFPAGSYADTSVNLFKIERNKNSNAVYYDVNIDDNGKINPKKPIRAYWILHEKADRRQNLTILDERAYGFRVKKSKGEDSFYFTIQSIKKRKIKIRQNGENIYPEILINGRPSILKKVYVKSKETFFLPQVKYIEFFGTDLETNEEVYEKFIK